MHMDETKKMLIKTLSPHLEEMVVNPLIQVHLVSRDIKILKMFLTSRKTAPFTSLGHVRSMIEYIDDIPLNAKK